SGGRRGLVRAHAGAPRPRPRARSSRAIGRRKACLGPQTARPSAAVDVAAVADRAPVRKPPARLLRRLPSRARRAVGPWSGEVEPVEVHDLVPRSDEVPDALVLRVVAG